MGKKRKEKNFRLFKLRISEAGTHYLSSVTHYETSGHLPEPLIPAFPL